MTDTFHEDKLKAARIYIAELIDKLDAAKFELAAVRNATLEEAAKVAEGTVFEEHYRMWSYSPGNRHKGSEIVKHSDSIASAIRALATPAIGEGR